MFWKACSRNSIQKKLISKYISCISKDLLQKVSYMHVPKILL